MKKTYVFVFSLFMMLVPTLIFGQYTIPDSTVTVVVRTTDDNEFVGRVVSKIADKIVLRTANLGDVTIHRRLIKSLKPVDARKVSGGEFWSDIPLSSRYYFQGNGYGLRKNEGYYQNTWVFYNQLSYGITDNFSIGVGTVPLFLFSISSTPVWITPKVSLPVVKDKFNIGAGAFLGTVLGENTGGFGIVYGSATAGSRNKNVSFGLGYGFADGQWASSPTVSISGVARVSKKFALMTENYLLNAGSAEIGILSGGGRFILRRISIDAALIIPISDEFDGFIAAPWLGFSVPFGKGAE
jgi:hypothetical protein